MPLVTLKKPSRLVTGGTTYERGIEVEVTNEVQRTLASNWRDNFDFHIEHMLDPVAAVVEGRGDLTMDDMRPGQPVGRGDLREEEQAKAKAKPMVPSSDADRLEALINAADILDHDNKEHFTKTGMPVAYALSQIVGWDVSAEERDSAFKPVGVSATPKKSSGIRVKVARRPEDTEGAVEV